MYILTYRPSRPLTRRLNSGVMQQLMVFNSVKRSMWWAYFVFLILWWVLSLFNSDHSISGVAHSAFFTFTLLGVWGYLRKLAIFSRSAWMAYFILASVDLAYFFVSTFQLAGPSDRTFLAVIFVTVAALQSPAWLALWLYAFRSSDVWSSPTNAA